MSQKEDGTLELKQNHQYYYQVQLQMKLCNVEYCDFVAWKKDGDMFIQRVVLDSRFIDDAIRTVEPVITFGILPELVARWFTRSKLPIDAPKSHGSPAVQGGSKNFTNDTDDPKVDESNLLGNKSTSTVDTDDKNDVGSTALLPSNGNSTNSQCIKDNTNQDICSSGEVVSNGNQKLWCYCSQSDAYDDMIGCDNAECKIQWFHWSCVNLTRDQLPDGDWFCFDCRKK